MHCPDFAPIDPCEEFSESRGQLAERRDHEVPPDTVCRLEQLSGRLDVAGERFLAEHMEPGIQTGSDVVWVSGRRRQHHGHVDGLGQQVREVGDDR